MELLVFVYSDLCSFLLRFTACCDWGTEGCILWAGRLCGLLLTGVSGDPPPVPADASVAQAAGDTASLGGRQRQGQRERKGQEREGQVQVKAQAEACERPVSAAVRPGSPLLELGPHQGAGAGDAAVAVVQVDQRRSLATTPRLGIPA